MAKADARDPLAPVLARLAVSAVDVRAPYDANALALCDYVRNLVRYVEESPETFVDLRRLAHLRAGDCDDMASMLAALLIRCGYRVRWAVGFTTGGDPVHIWVQAYSRRLGRWLDLDPSTWRVNPGTSPVGLAGSGVTTWRPFDI